MPFLVLCCQVVGLGVTGWFVYRYLGSAEDRCVCQLDRAQVLPT